MSASPWARSMPANERTYRLTLRAERFEPPHQHIEQAFARRLLRHVAQIRAEHGTIDIFEEGGHNRER